MAAAKVQIWYYVRSPDQPDAFEKLQGLTDTNGVFKASHKNTGSIDLGFQATKPGYYPTTKAHEFADFADSNPAKWNPTVTLVLKRIIHPIPMYAKLVDSSPRGFNRTGSGPFTLKKTAGYDLKVGDWVAPYGKGRTADIIFTRYFTKQAPNNYDDKLIVSFPNPDDGIQEYSIPALDEGSTLRSPHVAPVSGYQPKLVRNSYAHPGQHGKFDYNENRIYLFRVRTVLSKNGKVKSALYGKIYGDFEEMQFRYYLNPVPNDRNIEFNPKHNLLKLKRGEIPVRAP